MYEVLISHLRDCAKYDQYENTFTEAADAIEELEAVNQRQLLEIAVLGKERKTGKWALFGRRCIYGVMYECSACHAKYDGRTNFCPNCGAKMEVPTDV